MGFISADGDVAVNSFPTAQLAPRERLLISEGGRSPRYCAGAQSGEVRVQDGLLRLSASIQRIEKRLLTILGLVER